MAIGRDRRQRSGLFLVLLAFVPYVAYNAEHPAVRARLHLPGRWSDWLARALAEEGAELAVAIRPRKGHRRDAGVALVALIVVVAASAVMEQAATTLGAEAGLSGIVASSGRLLHPLSQQQDALRAGPSRIGRGMTGRSSLRCRVADPDRPVCCSGAPGGV